MKNNEFGMNNSIVVAVVVTYNRLNLLQRVVGALKGQSKKLDKIYIVNNGSTDGTKEWLDGQTGLNVIHQENVGGSGGFYRGIQEASKEECDWIWCMDDDVFPREDCLETLLNVAERHEKLGIICPHRLMSGKTFVGEAKTLNLTNPFSDMHNDMLTAQELESNETVSIVGMAFEGPLIRKEVVEKIGLPNKELFILYDDTDYSYRTVLAGYKVVVARDALMDKYDFQSKTSYREDKIKNKWKLAYHIRNTAYFGHRYGKNIAVRYMAALPFIMRMYAAITFNFVKGHKYSFSDYGLFWRMMRRGLREELGKM